MFIHRRTAEKSSAVFFYKFGFVGMIVFGFEYEQSLPCLKGGGFCEAKDGGILYKNFDFSLFSSKISPSHDFVVPAPFRARGPENCTTEKPYKPTAQGTELCVRLKIKIPWGNHSPWVNPNQILYKLGL